jgi:hypothetical protein
MCMWHIHSLLPESRSQDWHAGKSHSAQSVLHFFCPYAAESHELLSRRCRAGAAVSAVPYHGVIYTVSY